MAHVHVPARRVGAALAVTVLAAGAELAGSWTGQSLFLAADAGHLLAHTGIFAVLLIPPGWWHERGEDVATIAVLVLVLAVAVAMARTSIQDLGVPRPEPPAPSVMLLSLLGLGANLTTAYLFADPARQRWSFRAALAHELADGSLTVVGLVGAAAIKLFGWRWVDPGLSLTIAVWLGGWASRLLARRARLGRGAWTRNDHPGARRPPPPPQGAPAAYRR